MTSIAYSSVNIQASAQSVPSTPCWFGEMTLIAHHLQRQGMLAAIEEQVRFARRRFGRYEVIDFVAVLLGYAISGERTLEAFYERLQPWASAFMALFGRDRLPARSTLSRFLAALDQAAVEALRTLFLQDLLARPLVQRGAAGWVVGPAREVGCLSSTWMAHVRPLANAPCHKRRIGLLPSGACAPSAPLATPGASEGKSCERAPPSFKLIRISGLALLAILAMANTGQNCVGQWQPFESNLKAHNHPEERALLRLDGQYGTGAVLADLAGLRVCHAWQRLSNLEASRGPGSPETASRSAPDPSGKRDSPRALRLPWSAPGTRGYAVPGRSWQLILPGQPRVGLASPAAGVVYELFLTKLPQSAFTAADVVALYLHRGAFENALSDEDQEQDPDRWVSHAAMGQECWQIVSQWTWNLRLELGHQLHPDLVRTTEFAPAFPSVQDQAPGSPSPPQGYGPAEVALPWKTGRFSGQDFLPQPDGTLRCPAGQSLVVHERRREADGSLRVVYAASIRSCRSCPLRDQCQWQGSATAKAAPGERAAASTCRRF